MLNLSYISILLFLSITVQQGIIAYYELCPGRKTMITFCTLKMYPLCSFMNRCITLKQHMNYQDIEK